METRKPAVLVLAAGIGTRMRSRRPKVMHEIAGRSMIEHVLAAARALSPERIVVVIGPDMPDLAAAVAPLPTVVQDERRGTGHAVMAAMDALAGADGDVLVVYGDTPRLRPETLEAMLAARRGDPPPAVVVLGMRPDDPGQYGRLITDPAGGLRAIVEYRDADPDERAIDLVNSGVVAVDGAVLPDLLNDLTNDNAKGEYYLTDIVAAARRRGRGAGYVEAPADELVGINSRAELAAVEAQLQAELRTRAMAGGATLIAPDTVFLAADTELGRDVVVEPHVVFGPGVSVADDVTIRAFSHIEGARIAAGAVIGPFARLRPGADIGERAHIGNFVEVKNASLGEGAKANHLSYLGDATIGAGANIGAGTITCNYDGFAKWRTEIGAGAFIGTNTALVAPVKVGDGAVIGAGSVIAEDVPVDALGLTRPARKTVAGWAARNRARKTAASRKRKAG